MIPSLVNQTLRKIFLMLHFILKTIRFRWFQASVFRVSPCVCQGFPSCLSVFPPWCVSAVGNHLPRPCVSTRIYQFLLIVPPPSSNVSGRMTQRFWTQGRDPSKRQPVRLHPHRPHDQLINLRQRQLLKQTETTQEPPSGRSLASKMLLRSFSLITWGSENFLHHSDQGLISWRSDFVMPFFPELWALVVQW